jgi:branched-chain amino acid transport system ATP-binding protein
MKPKLLLLDEPAAGLNDTETMDLSSMIKKICGNGITIILVEHNMGLVMDISDRVLVLNYGKAIASGSPSEIQKNPEVIAAYLGE